MHALGHNGILCVYVFGTRIGPGLLHCNMSIHSFCWDLGSHSRSLYDHSLIFEMSGTSELGVSALASE